MNIIRRLLGWRTVARVGAFTIRERTSKLERWDIYDGDAKLVDVDGTLAGAIARCERKSVPPVSSKVEGKGESKVEKEV